jgi:hypothetical protein
MTRCVLFHVVFLSALALHAQPSQPPSPSAGKESSQDRNTQSNGKQTNPCPPLQGAQASPLWVKVIQAGTDKPETNPNHDKPENGSTQKGRVDPNWLIAIFTIVLAFVAAIQAGFFFWQLKMMKSSLADSKTAANAAEVAATIASNTERAWLITNVTFSSNWPDISGQTGPVKSVMVTDITNAGRSPAEIDSTHIVSLLVPKAWPLPENPTYGEIEGVYEVDSMPGEVIPVDKSRYTVSPIQRFDLLTDDQIEGIRAGILVLYCYGRIVYTDRSKVRRTTQFGYSFYRRKGELDGQPEGMYRLRSRKYNYTT